MSDFVIFCCVYDSVSQGDESEGDGGVVFAKIGIELRFGKFLQAWMIEQIEDEAIWFRTSLDSV